MFFSQTLHICKKISYITSRYFVFVYHPHFSSFLIFSFYVFCMLPSFFIILFFTYSCIYNSHCLSCKFFFHQGPNSLSAAVKWHVQSIRKHEAWGSGAVSPPILKLGLYMTTRCLPNMYLSRPTTTAIFDALGKRNTLSCMEQNTNVSSVHLINISTMTELSWI